MPQAIAEHLVHRQAAYGDLVGPFVCPASKVADLLAELPDGVRVDVSLVFDVTGDDAHRALRVVASDPRLTLAAVEAPLARLGEDAAVIGENLRRLPGTVGFLEVPRRDFDDGLDLVAKGGWQAAKYRTGGVTADAFPEPHELAELVLACVERGLPFKLTAGLHHAVRHRDPALGVTQHGVLNVLAAVRAALGRGGLDAVAGAIEDDSPDRAVDWSALTPDDCRSIRRFFRSFGCCGVTDPIGELTTLGLIEETPIEETL
jgi:hypothetical protein